MNADRFDALARTLTANPSRRHLLGAAAGGLLASRVQPAAARAPAAQATPAATPVDQATVCTNPDRTGLQDRAPGELVAFEEIAAAGDPNFPPGARAWRVLYVSTGRDNTERTLVCGVVIAPADGLALVSGDGGQRRGRVVSWSHGTVGLVPRCLPSTEPAAGIFGPTPVGFNLVGWTNDETGESRQSSAADGILAGMVAAGWLITATDYYADLWGGSTLLPFIIGKIEAANGIDIIRAAHQLMTAAGVPTGADAYDVVTWGHSQGGHAALWTAQLLEPYATATATSGEPTLALSGVALEAPASVLIAQPGDPGVSLGAGVVDWTLPAEKLDIADQESNDLLLAYIFAAWASYAAGGQPASDEMPAFPASGRGLDLATVLTPEAAAAIHPVAELCWSDSDLILPLVAPFGTTPFIVPELANGPTVDGVIHGNFDQTCAGDPSPAMSAWCDWFRFNTPGPRGQNPLPKLPQRGDALVPMLIAAGAADNVVHCITPPAELDAVPSGNDCVPAALYAALTDDYCPNGDVRGHLTLSIWRPEQGVIEAGHMDIPGILATADFETLRFEGSPLQAFITAAFDGTLDPGCTATVVNSGRSS